MTRIFAWVRGPAGLTAQIVTDAAKSSAFKPVSAVSLEDSDRRSLRTLIEDYPAPSFDPFKDGV